MKPLILAALLAAGLSTPAFAQQTAPSETTETFGAWTVRCVGGGTGVGAPAKACEVLHAVSGQGGVLAQMALAHTQTKGETVVAVRTPLGVLVSQPVSLALDKEDAATIEIGYVTCLAGGCIAQETLDAKKLASVTDGETVVLTFAERSGRKIAVKIPLSGLPDALSRLDTLCPGGVCGAD